MSLELYKIDFTVCKEVMEEYGIMELLELVVNKCGHMEFIWSGLISS